MVLIDRIYEIAKLYARAMGKEGFESFDKQKALLGFKALPLSGDQIIWARSEHWIYVDWFVRDSSGGQKWVGRLVIPD